MLGACATLNDEAQKEMQFLIPGLSPPEMIINVPNVLNKLFRQEVKKLLLKYDYLIIASAVKMYKIFNNFSPGQIWRPDWLRVCSVIFIDIYI